MLDEILDNDISLANDNAPITDAQINDGRVDTLSINVEGKINGLYYYYLEEGLLSYKGINNTTVLGTTNAICNVAYVPFLNLVPGDLRYINYDTDRFGAIGSSGDNPRVYRILKSDRPRYMDLIETETYPYIPIPKKGTQRNSALYESKLYDFPYRTIMFSGNMFDKYEVVPHIAEESYLPRSRAGYIILNACCPVSPGGNFFIEVEGYKSKTTNGGYLERYFVNQSFDMPNTSSAYSNYMSSQKARVAVNRETALASAEVTAQKNLIGGIAGAGGGALAGASVGSALGPIGTIAGGVIGGVMGGLAPTLLGNEQNKINKEAIIKNEMATERDLRTTPNTLKSMGGDIGVRLGAATRATVSVGDMIISDEYKQRIGDYFAMYGYKQNKLMPINIRSRWYYNYIKTIGCNIKGDGVPKQFVEAIKNVMDSGTTFWHLDRNGGYYCDYSLDNTEE